MAQIFYLWNGNANRYGKRKSSVHEQRPKTETIEGADSIDREADEDCGENEQ